MIELLPVPNLSQLQADEPDQLANEKLAPLIKLAVELLHSGRQDDALLLFDHLAELEPRHIALQAMLIELLLARGLVLDALQRYVPLQLGASDPGRMAHKFTHLINAAFAECQKFYDQGDAVAALDYLEQLADILPAHGGILGSALSCCRVLQRQDRVVAFATRLLVLEPGHVEARLELIGHLRRIGDRPREIAERLILLHSVPPIEPVNHGSNIYELINLMMCEPLTDEALRQIEAAQQTLFAIPPTGKPDSDGDDWVRFYKAMIGGIDLASLQRPPPANPYPLPPMTNAHGAPIQLADLRALAVRYQADAVFLVAGDLGYVIRYAGLYVRSILQNSDVACLIIVHVIGEAANLAGIAAQVGVTDERLVFTGDDFDASAITSTVLDAPSQPKITKPTAHYQSARFHQAGWVLYGLGLPLFVTDIDCLLERGVRDLLEREPKPDFILNENHVVYQFGARITANLLLFMPTAHSRRFIRFVSNYLDQALLKQDLAKFIDQIALAMGQHYMKSNYREVKIGYFDVTTDINNCILPNYMDHPFRFLSLYQSFDLETLPETYRNS